MITIQNIKNIPFQVLRKIFFLIVFSLLIVQTKAQVLYTYGSGIYIRPGADMYVFGGSQIDSNTTLINNGTLTIANAQTPGTITLNNNAAVSGGGIYRVEHNWINNASFISDTGTVELFSDTSKQLITSTNGTSTTFNNLILIGNGLGNARVKEITLDATVEGVLSLNNRELATGANTIFITNTSSGAVTNSQTLGDEGFVSSLSTGSISRKVIAGNNYLFPTGSSLATARYRPVTLNDIQSASTFGVRLVNNNPSSDFLGIEQRDNNIEIVNELYYHHINRISGNSTASINMYYLPSVDGKWKGIAQWGTPSTNVWNNLNDCSITEGVNWNIITKINWSDFGKMEFALDNPLSAIFIPQGFSPNGDGVNDFFTLYGTGDKKVSVEIFNRWGNKIYENNDYQNGWDGTSSDAKMVLFGEKLIGITLYYVINVEGEEQTRTGYLTLWK